MHKWSCLLLFLLACPALMAQDARIKHSVAYPSTTIAYSETDVGAMRNVSGIVSSLQDVVATFGGPSLHEYLTQRMPFVLTKEDTDAVAAGISNVSMGLLDVGLSGARWQFVLEGDDFTPLQRAIESASREHLEYVPQSHDHFGTPLWQVRLTPLRRDRAIRGWNMAPGAPELPELAWIGFVGKRFLVISSSQSAVGDAVDALQTPEDEFDTLAGNRRFRRGTAEFEGAQMLLFVNAPAALNAIERLGEGGPQMAGGLLMMLFMEFLSTSDDTPEAEFFAGLAQYEQINCWAAALRYDPDNAMVQMDMVTDYINLPEWMQATRVEPRARRIQNLLPRDTFFSFTLNVDDAAQSYRSLREFVFSRARNAGVQSIIDGWTEFEDDSASDGITFEMLLEHLHGEQTFLAFPVKDADAAETHELEELFGLIEAAVAFEVKDLAAAEEFLFGELSRYEHLRWFLGPIQDAMAPVEVINGIEVHMSTDGEYAIALLPRVDEQGREYGYILAGQPRGIKRLVAESTVTLAKDEAWRKADSRLFEASSTSMTLNLGLIVAGFFGVSDVMIVWPMEEDDNPRDDTKRDDNPINFIARMMMRTTILAAATTGDNRTSARVVMSGVPSEEDIAGLIDYIAGAERNRQVRDDLLRVHVAAEAHYVLEGEFATRVEQLNLERPEDGIDMWLADQGTPYALAELAPDTDIRQAVLLAYQPQPGLRGNHLAVLWNGDVVELTPDQLSDGLERAREGLPLENQGYTPVNPLILQDLSGRRAGWERNEVVWEEEEAEMVDVVIIDAEGNERVVKVRKGDAADAAERAVDRDLEKEADADED